MLQCHPMSDGSPSTSGDRRSPARAGVRAISPLIVAAFPFGLVYGVAVSRSPIDDWLGFLASFVVLAGAAQLTLVELIGASWIVAVGTALVINLRFSLYSAALAPAFSEFPTGWRLGLPVLLTDQSATTSLIAYEDVRDPAWRRVFYFAAALSFASAWWIGTAVGILFGGDIPDAWEIGFAVPLMFIALLVPTVRNRPTLVAALVGGAVAIAASGLPNGLNIVVGALAGVVAGTLTPDADEPRAATS